MHKDKFVFAQLVEFLDNNKFRRLVEKYNGDFHVRSFSCWNQLLALMFGQLSGRESLRDLIVTLEAHRAKCYHLGLGRTMLTKATFADANGKRSYRIFEDYAFYMMGRHGGNARRRSSRLAETSMRLTPRRFRSAWPFSPGQSSAGAKEVSRYMLSMIWRQASPLSTTLPLPP